MDWNTVWLRYSGHPGLNSGCLLSLMTSELLHVLLNLLWRLPLSVLPCSSTVGLLCPTYPLSLICTCPNHLSLGSLTSFPNCSNCPSAVLISNLPACDSGDGVLQLMHTITTVTDKFWICGWSIGSVENPSWWFICILNVSKSYLNTVNMLACAIVCMASMLNAPCRLVEVLFAQWEFIHRCWNYFRLTPVWTPVRDIGQWPLNDLHKPLDHHSSIKSSYLQQNDVWSAHFHPLLLDADAQSEATLKKESKQIMDFS